MAMWSTCTVTRAGAQLLMKMQEVEIYAARYGTETADDDNLKFQTDVSEPGGIMSVAELRPYDWGFEIVIRMDNSKLEEEITVRQIGFFARIKGENEEGVLFAVAQDEIGDRVPTPEDMPNFSLEFTIAVAADSDADISIVVDPTTTATVGYVETVRNEIEINITERIYELKEEINVYLNKKPDCHVFAQRLRYKSKPDYGFVGSGEYGLTIETGEYTGMAEVAIIREDNTLLDAKNITRNTINAPEGTFIITEE